MLDDGSAPFPEGLCPKDSEDVGWNATFYNVGGPGRVHFALFVDEEPKDHVAMDIGGDRAGFVSLAWSPEMPGTFQMTVVWGLDGGIATPGVGRVLAGPVTVAHPCWS